jgi:hypothetical protein
MKKIVIDDIIDEGSKEESDKENQTREHCIHFKMIGLNLIEKRLYSNLTRFSL